MPSEVRDAVWSKRLKKLTVAPPHPQEWAKGVRDIMERNGDAEVAIGKCDQGSFWDSACVYMYVCACTCVPTCVCERERGEHCGDRWKWMQDSCEAPADQGYTPRSSHRLLRAEYKLSGVTSAMRREAGGCCETHGLFNCGEGVSCRPPVLSQGLERAKKTKG